MNIMRGKSFGAMNVLFLAGIQSMILPSMYRRILLNHVPPRPLSNSLLVFFLIMQFVPAQYTFAGAEYVVVPSVLCLMPFSCLWAGTISSANGQGCDEPTGRRLSIGRRSSRVPLVKFFSAAKSNSATDAAGDLSGASERVTHMPALRPQRARTISTSFIRSCMMTVILQSHKHTRFTRTSPAARAQLFEKVLAQLLHSAESCEYHWPLHGPPLHKFVSKNPQNQSVVHSLHRNQTSMCRRPSG